MRVVVLRIDVERAPELANRVVQLAPALEQKSDVVVGRRVPIVCLEQLPVRLKRAVDVTGALVLNRAIKEHVATGWRDLPGTR